MYAPAEFGPPKAPRPPMAQERVIGLIVLLLLLFSCFFFALSADAQVFNPLNTVRPLTQTWRAQQTGMPRLGTRPPRPTATSRFGGGSVQDMPIFSHEVNTRDLDEALNDQLGLILGESGSLCARRAHWPPCVGERHKCRR